MKHFTRSPDCVFYVCCGSKCKKSGGKHLYKQLKSEIKHRRLMHQVQVIKTGCTDRCKMGPVVAVMPKNDWHLQVREEMAVGLIDQYLTPRRPTE